MSHTPTSSESHDAKPNLGFAGNMARKFIESPLTPLIYFACLAMGIMGLMLTPRQEDPQISVPMIDIFVSYPGAPAQQVESLAVEPLERILFEIPGVEHVYSASQRGQGVVTVQFEVGEQMEDSLVKINDKLDSNMDIVPPGVDPPLVKAKGIDDVPIVNITLWGRDVNGDGQPEVDDGQLRILAFEVLQKIKEIPETGNGFVVGGRREQVVVEVAPDRLAGFGISLDQVAQTIRSANVEQSAGGVEAGGSRLTVTTGSFLRGADEVSRLIVGSHNGSPVYVRDVANVRQRPEDASQIVNYFTGRADAGIDLADGAPAVTIAVAKKKGTNGVQVAEDIIAKVEVLEGGLLTSDVGVSVTRNYGETARDKVNGLILKLFIATGAVVLLVVGAFRAVRPALVVFMVIPVVILMTVFAAFVMNYTIDRVSLFALIFAIGILVDDAIVVVENIYRRWLHDTNTDIDVAVDAVREVGNPTILATFTVVAALLPMGFVSGMMGPYMEPIPALGIVAMILSLFAAFMFVPYLAHHGALRPRMSYLTVAHEREAREAERLGRIYERVLVPLIDHPKKRRMFNLVLWALFALACTMFYVKAVKVKMLPLDNKPEFSVTIDFPEGTSLPVTANLAYQFAATLRDFPEVTAVQTYVGVPRPFDFNGMVRHYYLREQPWQGEVQVQLLHRAERDRSSHEIAEAARELLTPMAQQLGARIAVVEMPPGPPVLQSVVADIHGPSDHVRRKVATEVTGYFERAPNIVDADNYMSEPYDYWRFEVDTEKAVRRGISVETINRNLAMALGGFSLGDVKQGSVNEPINIVIQVPLATRSEISRLNQLPIPTSGGPTVPLAELGRFVRAQQDATLFHKDLRAVEYVVGDVAGDLAAPVYGMFQVQDLMREDGYRTPDGVALGDAAYWLDFNVPKNDTQSFIEWTGEWTVTYETFRDMGAAFMVALMLIYFLVVMEFGNFRIPAVIMAPIPLTLLGIIPGHYVFGAEFTATSMIGWIALAGIIVRNSILLVDFSINAMRRGATLKDSVVESCKTRTRPILITAFALVGGAFVILTDPIFQGMAISLMAGVVVSTMLTLIVVPLGCVKAKYAMYEVVGTVAPVTSDASAAPARPATEPRPAAAAGTPLWVSLWSKLITVISWTYYIVRALGMLAMESIRSLIARWRKPKARSTVWPAIQKKLRC